MKKLLLILTVVLSTTFLSNQANAADMDVCKEIEVKAKAIMKSRQQGVSLKQMVLFFMEHEGATIPSDNIMLLIETAYGVQMFRSNEYKDKATKEFADATFLQCLRS